MSWLKRASLATTWLLVWSAPGKVGATSRPAIGGQLNVGGGAGSPPGRARGALLELAPRLEMVWGGDVGAGPTIEFRTSNFASAELTGGLGGVLSDGDVGALATLAGGYAWRRADEAGAVVAATIGYGVVHVRAPWLASTAFYLSLRHSATGPSRDEITVGVSFGGGVLNALGRIGRDPG